MEQNNASAYTVQNNIKQVTSHYRIVYEAVRCAVRITVKRCLGNQSKTVPPPDHDLNTDYIKLFNIICDLNLRRVRGVSVIIFTALR